MLKTLLNNKAIFLLIRPVVVDILKDIIVSANVGEKLGKLRQEVIDRVLVIVGKTSFTWDDKVAEIVIGHMKAGNVIDGITGEILVRLEEWVLATETKWDDDVILPILTQWRLAIEEKEVEE